MTIPSQRTKTPLMAVALTAALLCGATHADESKKILPGVVTPPSVQDDQDEYKVLPGVATPSADAGKPKILPGVGTPATAKGRPGPAGSQGTAAARDPGFVSGVPTPSGKTPPAGTANAGAKGTAVAQDPGFVSGVPTPAGKTRASGAPDARRGDARPIKK